MALEILHDVEETVVDLGLFLKLDLDGIEVTEGIGDVERATRLWGAVESRGGVGGTWRGRLGLHDGIRRTSGSEYVCWGHLILSGTPPHRAARWPGCVNTVAEQSCGCAETSVVYQVIAL